MKATDYLGKNLGIPGVRCEDDVNACATGEERFGPGNSYTDFTWMTMGISVDGAVAESLKLARGGLGFTGELGYSKVEYKSPAHCPCGQYGYLETHGSGTALIRETRGRRFTSPAFAKALDEMGLKPDGAGCAALVRTRNMDALDILNQIGTYLGRGIPYCINILNAQTVVTGGGVVMPLGLLLPPVHVSVQQNVSRQMQDIDVIKTPLGYETVPLGAAILVPEQ